METPVVLGVCGCSDKCVCDRVADFFGSLGLGRQPLAECIISDIITNTLTECIEFANLAFG
jgi:hypothetical protein